MDKRSYSRTQLISKITVALVKRLKGEVIDVSVDADFYQVGDLVRFDNRSWRIGERKPKNKYGVPVYTMIPMNIFN